MIIRTTYRQHLLGSMIGGELNSVFVHLIYFSAAGQFCASKPPLHQAKNSYL